MARELTTLTDLARLGFAELDEAASLLAELGQNRSVESLVAFFADAANPDQALRSLAALLRQSPEQVGALLERSDSTHRLIRVLGASAGLAEFFLRRPDELDSLGEAIDGPRSVDEYRADLLASVEGLAVGTEEAAWNALRARYRRHLGQLTAFDLAQADPLGALDTVAAALADLAAAALDASLT
jgi:glutamate-ammonia-ligase adenylyltransferase